MEISSIASCNSSGDKYLFCRLCLGFFLSESAPETASPRHSTASAAFSLGIPHPPGYVMYVLLGKIITFCVPWGNEAFKVNCLSIVFGALAVSFLYLILRCYIDVFSSLGGSICFALIPSLWRLSQVSELYSINICFGALILLWLLKENNVKKSLYIGALLCGLGLANHQTLMFFFPGYALLIWNKYPNFKNIKNIPAIILI